MGFILFLLYDTQSTYTTHCSLFLGWYLDRRTILHEFYYTSDGEESGTCVATWLSRKNVKCKWRRLYEDNDYSEEEESESELDNEQKDRKRRAAIVVTPLKNLELEESGDDEDSNISIEGGVHLGGIVVTNLIPRMTKMMEIISHMLPKSNEV